jgi:hypothetical protein
MQVYVKAVSDIGHVALVPEVQHALAKWIESKIDAPATHGVLIGGLAMSFYTRPRATTDVDLLFLSNSDIPGEVAGFKRYRNGAFQEYKTQVDIEVTTPESFVTLPQSLAQEVINTAVFHGGIKVASLCGMIALKLCGAMTPKRKLKDLADVAALVEGKTLVEVCESLKTYTLGAPQLALLHEVFDALEG